MKKQELTEIQKKILEILKSYISKHSIPPTIKEISALCGLSSTSSVHHQLSCLEEKGYIVRDKTKSRSIKLTGKRISTKKSSNNKDVKKKDTKKKDSFETTKLEKVVVAKNVEQNHNFEIINKAPEISSELVTEETLDILPEQDSAPTVEDLADYAGDFDFASLYEDYQEPIKDNLKNDNLSKKPAEILDDDDDDSEPLESMIHVEISEDTSSQLLEELKRIDDEDFLAEEEPIEEAEPIESLPVEEPKLDEPLPLEEFVDRDTADLPIEKVKEDLEVLPFTGESIEETLPEEASNNVEVDSISSKQEEPKLFEYTFAGFDKNLSPISRDVFNMPSEFTGVSDAMLYEVNADELENFGIYIGDVALIEYNSEPKNGDIVFAVYDRNVILRQVKFLSHVAILSTGNKNDINTDRSNLVFIGVVKGLFRTAFSEKNKTEENKQYPLIKYVNNSIEIITYYKLPPRLLGVSEAFLFAFDTDDMAHFNVLKGDFGIFEYMDAPKDGDLALLLVDGKIILRIVKITINGNYILISGSSEIPNIEIEKENLVCFGSFKGLFRKF